MIYKDIEGSYCRMLFAKLKKKTEENNKNQTKNFSFYRYEKLK